MTGELTIVIELAGIEIHAITRLVREALLLKSLDPVDLLLDMVGGFRPDVWLRDIELMHVFFECLGIMLRDVPDSFTFFCRAFLHLVLSAISIIRQMTDISYVHDVRDIIAVSAQDTFQNVLEEVRPEVADMGIVIDCRATGIEPDVIIRQGGKRFFCPVECIK